MKISCKSGNPEDKFAKAYEEYADAIFRHCVFRVFNRELAKELMQGTFMKAWEYLVSGKDIDNVRPFLYRIANNLVIDHVRRKKHRKEVSLEDLQEDGFDVEGSGEEEIRAAIDAQYIASTLQKIEEPYRSTLIMRYIDELKPAEIAESTGESANVISVRLNRGLKQLRPFLSNE